MMENDDDISIHPQDKQGNSITMIDAIIYDILMILSWCRQVSSSQ